MFAILREVYSTCLNALTGNVAKYFFPEITEGKAGAV